MDCPKCIGRLHGTALSGHWSRGGTGRSDDADEILLEVDRCFKCGGVWFDKGELDKYLAEGMTVIDSPSHGKASNRMLDQKTGKCPRCAIELDKSASSKDDRVTVDVCPKCHGIWLDATEIDRLERADRFGSGFIGALFAAFR